MASNTASQKPQEKRCSDKKIKNIIPVATKILINKMELANKTVTDTQTKVVALGTK